MPADLAPALVDERTLRCDEPAAIEERPVVVTGEEARLLALGTARDGESGCRCFGARLVLRLVAEREEDAVEERRVEPGEHVRLILLCICGAREEPAPAVLDDTGVVSRREASCARPAREREQLGEAKAAVAADARIGRLAARVAAHERLDDRPAELLAQ